MLLLVDSWLFPRGTEKRESGEREVSRGTLWTPLAARASSITVSGSLLAGCDVTDTCRIILATTHLRAILSIGTA